MRASTTPNADLLAHARNRGVKLTPEGARQLRARQGGTGPAMVWLDQIADLRKVAHGLGQPLNQRAATTRLTAAEGSLQLAIDRLLAHSERHANHIFHRETERLEAEWWSEDARTRHPSRDGWTPDPATYYEKVLEPAIRASALAAFGQQAAGRNGGQPTYRIGLSGAERFDPSEPSPTFPPTAHGGRAKPAA